MEEEDPSPFYVQFADAQPYLLVYPSRDAEGGPHWSDNGDLIDPDDAEVTEESIQAVPLGKGRYRLAARCDGPFSALRLNWGDEFEAEETEPGILELQRVVMPQHYAHLRCSSDADLVPERATAYAMPYSTAGCLNFSNDHPIAQLVHDTARRLGIPDWRHPDLHDPPGQPARFLAGNAGPESDAGVAGC